MGELALMAASKIKVLHLLASNFVGGPEKQILHHALDVREAGVEVYVGSFRDQAESPEILKEAEQSGLATYQSKFSRKFDLRAVRELASFLKRERIQLLCTHGFKATTIGALSKRIAAVPQIAFCRGWTGETPRVRAYEFLERRALRLADHIVCVSEAQAKILGRNSQLRSRITVVHNAMVGTVSPASEGLRAAHKAQLGFPPDTLLIGAVGRLSIEKGQRYLVDAAAQLVHQFPEIRFVLLGEGRERANLEAQIKRLGLEKIIQLQGFEKNISPWFKAFNVLVNCSLTEGIPNAILEALSAGTPVVATAVGGVPELIKDRETGLLVAPADSAAMARGLVTVLRDPRLASALSKAGQEWVETRFSPIRQRDSLLAIYCQSLGLSVLPAEPERKDAGQHSPAISASFGQTFSTTIRTDSLPFISVIIPVRNEELHLRAVLQDLLAQNYPRDRYEILIADGDSTDGTVRVVEEVSKVSETRIKLLSNPGKLSSAGRNVGVRNSSGELIVFIDGHCRIPSRQLLLDTADIFQTTGADCLCRPQPLDAPGNDGFQEVVAAVRASTIGHGLDSTIFSMDLEGYINPISSGASYRRRVFDLVGFYNEKLDACEDVEFNYRVARAGLRSYISPRLTIQYWPRNTLSSLWKQMVRYGRGRYRFACIHREALSVAQVIPAFFIVWVIFSGLATLGSRFFASIFMSTLGAYAAVVIASSVWLGIRNGWRHLFTAPVVYPVVHFGLGFGFLVEAVQPARRRGSSKQAILKEESHVVTDGLKQSSCTQTSHVPFHLSLGGQRSSSGVDTAARFHLAFSSGNKTAPLNAFTVDVEDYFHTEAMSSFVSREHWNQMPSRVQSNTYRLFEMLAKYNVRGTFFFLGWVAEHFPALVRDAVQLGHEVACHSYWHRPVYRLSRSEFREDTLRAKAAIENAGGIRVRGYRAPSFSLIKDTEWAFDILAELGFSFDSSVHPIRHDLYGNPDAPRVPYRTANGAILELPIATIRIGGSNFPCGGGGYLRLFPYAYLRWGLSRFNTRDARSAVVYMHPWELDPHQPRLAVDLKTRIRQYSGLASAEHKVDSLLRNFRFGTISDVFHREFNEPRALSFDVREVAHSRR